MGFLKHDYFSKYVGLCNQFDFFYLYDKFDFTKFEIDFILNRKGFVYEKLAESDYVKSQIRNKISVAIQNGNLHPDNENQLKNILIDYFC